MGLSVQCNMYHACTYQPNNYCSYTAEYLVTSKYELIHSHMHKHCVSPLCTRLWGSVHQKQVLSELFVAVRKTRHCRIQQLRGSDKLGVNYVTVELKIPHNIMFTIFRVCCLIVRSACRGIYTQSATSN